MMIMLKPHNKMRKFKIWFNKQNLKKIIFQNNYSLINKILFKKLVKASKKNQKNHKNFRIPKNNNKILTLIKILKNLKKLIQVKTHQILLHKNMIFKIKKIIMKH